jgi:hypothetical protein
LWNLKFIPGKMTRQRAIAVQGSKNFAGRRLQRPVRNLDQGPGEPGMVRRRL